jgi:hypothetical protein
MDQPPRPTETLRSLGASLHKSRARIRREELRADIDAHVALIETLRQQERQVPDELAAYVDRRHAEYDDE